MITLQQNYKIKELRFIKIRRSRWIAPYCYHHYYYYFYYYCHYHYYCYHEKKNKRQVV